MISIIPEKMHLFVLISSLSILSVISSKIINYILGLFNRPTKAEKELHREVVEIRQTLAGIPMVDNFVAHAKLQRKLNVVENNLREETNKRLSAGIKYKTFIPYALNIILSIYIIYISFVYRNEPVINLQQFNLFPVSMIISYPLHEIGSISVPAWFFICKIVLRQVVN